MAREHGGVLGFRVGEFCGEWWTDVVAAWGMGSGGCWLQLLVPEACGCDGESPSGFAACTWRCCVCVCVWHNWRPLRRSTPPPPPPPAAQVSSAHLVVADVRVTLSTFLGLNLILLLLCVCVNECSRFQQNRAAGSTRARATRRCDIKGRQGTGAQLVRETKCELLAAAHNEGGSGLNCSMAHWLLQCRDTTASCKSGRSFASQPLEHTPW